jgi:hypothetical protein
VGNIEVAGILHLHYTGRTGLDVVHRPTPPDVLPARCGPGVVRPHDTGRCDYTGKHRAYPSGQLLRRLMRQASRWPSKLHHDDIAAVRKPPTGYAWQV